MAINGEPSCVTVTVRRDGADAAGQVYRTIAAADPALATAIHDANEVSPWSVQLDGEVTHVTIFDAEVAAAFVAGAKARGDVKTIRPPVTARWCIDCGDGGAEAQLTTLAPVRTSASMRGARGLTERPDALFPDPARIINDLGIKWANLGWPDLPHAKGNQIHGALLKYSIAHLHAGRLTFRGWHGVLHLDMRLMCPEDRAVIWTLLRFGELRNVGRNVSYGMGAIRVERR